MSPKPQWTSRLRGPIRVLHHAEGWHLEHFTDAYLDQIADCNDVCAIDLRSNHSAQPVDLSRLAHITRLRSLRLERMLSVLEYGDQSPAVLK